MAGVLLLLAFPPHGRWLLAPVGVGVLVLAVRGATARGGALVGLVGGLAFLVPLLRWSGVEVGMVPWLLLALSQALFFAVMGAALAVTAPLRGWPVLAACLWVAQEALRGRLPYGGFPWGRLGFASADAPWLHLAPLGGVPLVTFGIALTGSLAAAAALALATRRALPAALFATAAIGLLLGPLALALPSAPAGTPSAVVALVQGNVPAPGLDFNAERQAVLRNHVRGTRELAAAVRAGRQPRPDLVVWPENGSDLDPFTDPSTYALIDEAVRDVGVPVLVGAVLRGPGEKISNTGIVWDPQDGPGERYVKRHPVPFAEYIPMRGLARLVSADVDRVGRDMAAGATPGVLPVGPVPVGDVICFEVGYDGLVRDVVRGGGRLVTVQTNNATFGFTPQTEQQLVMTRVRAAEHGRATVSAATSGVSAVVAPDGALVARSGLFTPALLVERVPLLGTETPATRLGNLLEAGLALSGALAVTLALLRGRRR